MDAESQEIFKKSEGFKSFDRLKQEMVIKAQEKHSLGK